LSIKPYIQQKKNYIRQTNPIFSKTALYSVTSPTCSVNQDLQSPIFRQKNPTFSHKSPTFSKRDLHFFNRTLYSVKKCPTRMLKKAQLPSGVQVLCVFWLYMNVHIYICTYIHVYIYTYIYVCTHKYIYLCIYIHVRKDSCTDSHKHQYLMLCSLRSLLHTHT